MEVQAVQVNFKGSLPSSASNVFGTYVAPRQTPTCYGETSNILCQIQEWSAMGKIIGQTFMCICFFKFQMR